MGARLLVVEGNAADVRARQVAAGKATTADAYAGVLHSLAPDAICTTARPADDDWTALTLAELKQFDGAVFTGSALHAYDETPQVQRQIDLARSIFAAGIAFFGSCWGLQVAAVAAGGQVARNPKGREIGFARNIVLTEAGSAHPMYRGKPRVFDAPAVHLDEIATLPPDVSVLAGNGMSAVQAVEIRHDRGVFWGVQYHPEYSVNDVAATLRRYGSLLVEEGLFANDAARDAFVRDLEGLHTPGGRSAFLSHHGLDATVLDLESRLAELRNWINFQVL